MQRLSIRSGHYPTALAALLLLPLMFACIKLEAADNLQFHGALTAQPCTLAPEDTTVPLDFGSVIAKDLYRNQRTTGKTLTLNLRGCDTQVADHVTVTFRGTEDARLPGLIALSSDSQAAGVAIGMEMDNGHPVPLNKPTESYLLADGDNAITLRVYVQGEQQAIANQAIVTGTFNAAVTFDFEYQ